MTAIPTDGVLTGIRVLEIAEYGVGPSAGAALADWGAEVVKVERPSGDPVRVSSSSGAAPGGAGVDLLTEIVNRNKQVIALDLTHPEARPVIERLIAWADVFLTSFLPETRRKLRLDPDDVFAINASIIYGRASGQGQRGPHASYRAFDASAFWARSGVAWMHSPPDGLAMPRPAFGDLTAGFNLAGGVAAALVRRERTGQGGIVDVSLLSTALWMLSVDLGSTSARRRNPKRTPVGKPMPNPLLGPYRTADGRWMNLSMFNADREFPGFCRALERLDLLSDVRFATAPLRAEHRQELHKVIWEELESKDLEHWKKHLNAEGCTWWWVAEPIEVLDDPQVEANGYLMPHPANPAVRLPATPVQFDEQPIQLRSPTPPIGADTDTVLRQVGFDDDNLAALRAAGAVV